MNNSALENADTVRSKGGVSYKRTVLDVQTKFLAFPVSNEVKLPIAEVPLVLYTRTWHMNPLNVVSGFAVMLTAQE